MNTAHLVAGLAYGDEGKGATVDYLVRKYQASLVVRYNGGAQAAHNVITQDGKHHTFAQFGSGTFAGAKTHLSQHVLIEPRFMMHEANHLKELGEVNIWNRITIDERALVITPFQIAVNRIIESYRNKVTHNEHGTCGMGIGVTRSDHLNYGDNVLFACDLRDKEKTIKKLRFLQSISYEKVKNYIGCKPQISDGPESVKLIQDLSEYYWEAYYKEFQATIVKENYLGIAMRNQNVVFEGAQGLLLDEKYGIPPHYTWTDITFNNANELLARGSFTGRIERVGCLRTYFTRHGAGPLRQINPNLHYPELHNTSEAWQGEFRLGNFDFNEALYAFNAIGGTDVISLSHLDVLTNEERNKFISDLKKFLPVDRFILGFGPTAENRREKIIRSKNDYDNNDDFRRSICCS